MQNIVSWWIGNVRQRKGTTRFCDYLPRWSRSHSQSF